MNDKDWDEKEEFWDSEIGEDDEDNFNGMDGNIDANNDETFGDAAEWNEDEHEELIARDLILSNLNSPQKQVSQPKVLTVDQLEREFLKTNINQSPQQAPTTSKAGPEPSRRSGWSPFGSKDLFNTDDPNLMSNPLLDPTLLQNIQPQTLTLEQHRLILEQQQKILQRQQLQLQQFALFKQQQLQLQQLALFKQQQLQQQHNRQQHQLNQQRQIQQRQQLQQQQQNTDPGPISSTAQCYTVEELERQMLANRGNKTEEPKPKSVNLIRLAPEKPVRPEPVTKQQSDENRHRNFQERRNGDRREGKFERHNNHRESSDSRDHHRDRRDNKNHRDHFKHHKKEPKIVPPQVQLGVIEKAKRMHPITPMHSDEFLQDRIPTTGDGFRFSRHSNIADAKADHDGVLTDKERDWLTRIQEKIQADYDDNIDQDYYYLLYFNRSSMSNEATQKPSGPGVFDRRFIPRERLLYNSGV